MNHQLFTRGAIWRTSIIAVVVFIACVMFALMVGHYDYFNLVVCYVISIAVGISCVYGLHRLFGKENQSEWPQYCRQIPDPTIPLFWARSLADQNPGIHVGVNQLNKDLIATLFDLCSKKIYATQLATGGDLYIQKSVRTGIVLQPFEMAAMEFFDLLIGNGSNMSEIHAHAQEQINHGDFTLLNDMYLKATKEITAESERQSRVWLNAWGVILWMLGMFILWILLLVVVFKYKSFDSSVILLGVGVGFSTMNYGALTRIRPDRNAAVGQWVGFQRFLKDFPIFKHVPVSGVKLWEDFFMYALVFGYTEEIIKTDHISLPVELKPIDSTLGSSV